MRTALILGLVAIVVACGSPASPAANATPSTQQGSVASAPRIAPAPVSPPTPPGDNLPGFVCADAGGGKTGATHTTTARVGEDAGYDRFVLQFDTIVPVYTVKRQAKPVFTLAPSGQQVTLSGSAGVLVKVSSATGDTTFTGSTDLVHPEFRVLREARQVQDFEGTVEWALGLSQPACMRTFTLADPARLIVDFATTS